MDKSNFNPAWANKVSKEQFIKQHEHHADDVDLGAIWEELQSSPEEKAKEEPKKSSKK